MTRRTTFCCCILLALIADCGKKPGTIEFRGVVSGMIGDAAILAAGKSSWEPLELGSSIALGDSIQTKPESQVEITFDGSNTLQLDENSAVRITQAADSADNPVINVAMGGGTILSNIKKISGGNDKYRVSTPTAVAAIRGTFFSVIFDPVAHASHVHCLEGKVWVVNPFLPPAPPFIIVPGFFTSVGAGVLPVAPAKIPPGHWKRLHRMLPQPMFIAYTKKFQAEGVDDLLRLPGPVDMRGRHVRIRHEEPVVPPGLESRELRRPESPERAEHRVLEKEHLEPVLRKEALPPVGPEPKKKDEEKPHERKHEAKKGKTKEVEDKGERRR